MRTISVILLGLACTAYGRPLRMRRAGTAGRAGLTAAGGRTASSHQASTMRLGGTAAWRTRPTVLPKRSAPTAVPEGKDTASSRNTAGNEIGIAGREFATRLKAYAQDFLQADAVRHLLAGAAAGVISTTATAPLEVLRINCIVSTQQTNALRLARQIYAEGGLLAFWAGNSADVLRTIPASALRFCSFAVYKERLPECFAKLGIHSQAVTSLFAGGFAGMTSMAILFPLETMRTQMAARAVEGVSMMGFGRSLLASQGVGAFYRGLPASLVSVMPFFAVRFGAYDILKRWHMHMTDGAEIPSQFGAVYGFTSSLAATALTFPMEMVRRRAMLGLGSSNLLQVIPAIVKADGFFGLYKGYGLNVMKVGPASALTFCMYELVRQGLDEMARKEELEVVECE